MFTFAAFTEAFCSLQPKRQIWFSMLFVVFGNSNTFGELSPEAYEKMLHRAEEVYQIKVLSVEAIRSDEWYNYYKVTASLVTAERTMQCAKDNSTVEYVVPSLKEDAYARGFVGPARISRPAVGWQGRIYLNLGYKGELEPAAFSKSFVRLRSLGEANIKGCFATVKLDSVPVESRDGELGVVYYLDSAIIEDVKGAYALMSFNQKQPSANEETVSDDSKTKLRGWVRRDALVVTDKLLPKEKADLTKAEEEGAKAVLNEWPESAFMERGRVSSYVLGMRHPKTCDAILAQAAFHENSGGDRLTARRLIKKAVEALRQSTGSDSHATRSAIFRLAESHLSEEEWRDALPYVRAAASSESFSSARANKDLLRWRTCLVKLEAICNRLGAPNQLRSAIPFSYDQRVKLRTVSPLGFPFVGGLALSILDTEVYASSLQLSESTRARIDLAIDTHKDDVLPALTNLTVRGGVSVEDTDTLRSALAGDNRMFLAIEAELDVLERSRLRQLILQRIFAEQTGAFFQLSAVSAAIELSDELRKEIVQACQNVDDEADFLLKDSRSDVSTVDLRERFRKAIRESKASNENALETSKRLQDAALNRLSLEQKHSLAEVLGPIVDAVDGQPEISAILKKAVAAPTLGDRPGRLELNFTPADAQVAQEEWAHHLRTSSKLWNSIGMAMELIPPGSFTMGDFNGGSDEWPAHRVTLSQPFMLGVHEVTQAQYEQVMGSNPSYFKGRQNPVERVSWNDAMEFCQKLSALPEERSAGRVYRLPTEAEWEYACRAGTTTKHGFGDDASDLGEYAWYSSNSGSQTHPVGQKQPNAWGLYDMHGNVFEWCADWYDDYPSGSATDPSGPQSGSDRVFRGGSWRNTAEFCRSAYRYGYGPSNRYINVGFRVTCVPSGQ